MSTLPGQPLSDDLPHIPMQQRVQAHIRAMIEDGRIRPGERLLEVHVARAFGVSRSPARHALEALCAERIVRAAPGRGFVVAGGGRGSSSAGALANIDLTVIEPTARWRQVLNELEKKICVGVVYHTLRITEERVAEHFGVSRTVARDALARLHSSGLVDKGPQGRWIAERLTADRLRFLYELRWLLEPAALLQSAPATDPQRFRQAHKRLMHALKNIPQLNSDMHIELESDLHVDMLAACQNTELLRTLLRTQPLLVSNPHRLNFYLGASWEHTETSLRQHAQVLELLMQADFSAAADALRFHLQDTCDFWERSWGRVEDGVVPIELPGYLTPI